MHNLCSNWEIKWKRETKIWKRYVVWRNCLKIFMDKRLWRCYSHAGHGTDERLVKINDSMADGARRGGRPCKRWTPAPSQMFMVIGILDEDARAMTFHHVQMRYCMWEGGRVNGNVYLTFHLQSEKLRSAYIDVKDFLSLWHTEYKDMCEGNECVCTSTT